MTKFIFLLIFFVLAGGYTFGQKLTSKEHIKQLCKTDKKPIDSACYNRWPVPEGVVLTDDGRFFLFMIENEFIGSSKLVLQATEGGWKREFHNMNRHEFSSDGKLAVVGNSDKIYIVNLGTTGLDSVDNISSYLLSDDGEWLAYQQKESERKLVVRNLRTNRSSSYLSVRDYFFGKNKDIIFVTEDTQNRTSEISQALHYANVFTGVTSNIWKGDGIRNIILSNDGNNLAFIAKDKSSTRDLEGIWYYKFESSEASFVLSGGGGVQNDSLKLSQISSFSNDNTRLFVLLEKKKLSKRNIDPSLPDVWNFNDKKLQSQQLLEDGSRTYTAVVDIQRKELIPLEGENEAVVMDNQPLQDSVAILLHRQDNGSWEVGWNPASNSISYLISTKTGKKTSIDGISRMDNLKMSAYGKYLIYFDRNEKNYFTYEINNGIIRNISKGISADWEVVGIRNTIEGWLKDDSGVIVNDKNDLWLLDPSGIRLPINVTNGYGKRKNIILSLTWSKSSDAIIDSEKTMFLTAFNPKTKENGFFSTKLGRKVDPVLLTMGPFIYDIPYSTAIPQGSSFTPLRAKKENAYIVRRMGANEYPNLWYTTDFKSFRKITNFQPQAKYNWYTTELHEWVAPDRIPLQGILYKPENFDSSKKYPVIFNYYETKSDGLHAFIRPAELSGGGNINIPYYVSNGYLVFCPDIEYKIGDPMQGTYNAIVSAAEYLSKLPFVDSKKMGLQGFSWGAIQTNYLVITTNLFAAASSVSGMGDWISGFGSLNPYGNSLQGLYIGGQQRMGNATLWDKPETYIKNSAVLGVDRISTPILLAHTKDDGVCPISNVIEFFTGLRRLGKRSWMLVYPGDHGIEGKEGIMDFSIRMKQFFDHYLKDMPAPIWMTKGIPAKLKGIDKGLDLDSTIKTPVAGLLTPDEQRKVDSIMVRKPIMIELK